MEQIHYLLTQIYFQYITGDNDIFRFQLLRDRFKQRCLHETGWTKTGAALRPVQHRTVESRDQRIDVPTEDRAHWIFGDTGTEYQNTRT